MTIPMKDIEGLEAAARDVMSTARDQTITLTAELQEGMCRGILALGGEVRTLRDLLRAVLDEAGYGAHVGLCHANIDNEEAATRNRIWVQLHGCPGCRSENFLKG